MAKPRRAGGFYDSPQWAAVRALVLKRDGYRCTVCGCSVQGKGNARVDHVQSIHDRPDLRLVPGNLRTLCPEHDNQAHRETGHHGKKRDAQFFIRDADRTGMPLDPSHPWHNGR